MKNSIKILLAVLMLFTIACKKEKAKTNALTGLWRFDESYVNTGGNTVSTSKLGKEPLEFIQFKEDGSFNGALVYKEYKTYKILDGTTVILIKADNTSQKFNYTIKPGILTLSQVEPVICNEGCGNIFSYTHRGF